LVQGSRPKEKALNGSPTQAAIAAGVSSAEAHDTCTQVEAQQHCSIRTCRTEKVHCGGCGTKHSAAYPEVTLVPLVEVEAALAAAGRRSAHVAGVYVDDEFKVLAVSPCCRNAADAATYSPDRPDGAIIQYGGWREVFDSERERDEADRAMARSERMHASSYGLGL
jgi:hypothetical protein